MGNGRRYGAGRKAARAGLVFCAGLLVPAAPAQAASWNNLGTGGWLFAGNWDPFGVPGPGDNAIIDNGGTALIGALDVAESNAAYIGDTAGNSGAVGVNNAGVWTNSGILYVGNSGSGTLGIAGGGAVSNTLGYIGLNATGTGEVTVSGADSTWTNSAELYVGSSGSGTLGITSGGVVSNTFAIIADQAGSSGDVTVDGAGSEWNMSSNLAVGNSGDATLAISDGGAVSNVDGLVGYFAAGSSAVTVDGADSTWTNSGELNIGVWGGATLDITGGGVVSNATGYIGRHDTGSGEVTVDGADSTWTNSGVLRIGDSGAGTLGITGGGAVSNTLGYIGTGAGSSGTVTVDGAGSTWTNSSGLYVGNSGSGTLGIAGGGAVLSQSGHIGTNASGSGAVRVDGADSTWTNSGALIVGRAATGSGGNPGGTLDITDGGAVFNTNGTIGDLVGGTGEVTVDGADSTWTNSGWLTVGNSGSGTLDIAGGGEVLNTVGYIGINATGTGEVTVSGAGSWTSSAELFVGFSGSGTLDISGGGAVSNTSGSIGNNATGTGEVTVDGANSTWTNSSWLAVGVSGAGTLGITGGGAVSNTQAFIGYSAGGTGEVTVSGADSIWTASAELYVGTLGDGTLDIADGGAVSNTTGSIGEFAASIGTVVVDGANSTWTNSGSLTVGNFGAGTLTLSGGGSAEATTVTIANDASATGTLNIGAAALDAADAAGTLDATALVFGAGAGTLVFNHTETDYDFDLAISGAGTIDHRSGFTTLTADSSTFAGTTSLQGGTLIVDGQLGGDIGVTGGVLGGSGTVGTTALGAGAIVAPGNSIGTLNVAGNFTFDPDATYEVEVDPSGTDADLIHVTGQAFLNNATVRHIGMDGTYAPSSIYTILTADLGIDGTFGSILSDYAFLDAALDYDANNVYLELVRNDIDFAAVAHTPNQQGVGGALQNFGPGHPLYDEIVTMTDEEARAAYDALSGEAHASSLTAQLMTAQQIRQQLLDRLAAILGSGGGGLASLAHAPAAGDAAPGAAAVWGQVFGSWGRTDDNGNAATIDRDSYGFIGGIDREIAPGVRAGIAAGYSRSSYDVKARSSTGDSDNFHIAGYAGTTLGNLGLKGILSYAYGKADARRTVIVGGLTNNLAADYATHTFQAGMEAGYDLDWGALTLTPFAGLAAVHVETEGFTETGGPAALTFASTGATTGISTLGLRARHQAGSVGLTGAAAWRHAFGDVEPTSRAAFASAPAAAFAVRGTPVAENALALDAAASARLGAGTTLTFGYAGELASSARDHGLRAELRVEF
ncbi:MAG: autotransporter domain-containing protein [Parvibaculum sp.]|nr:autotransporter domain-containing protein [Parvibaculum sp.]